jgi:hypothetical protein
VKARRKEPDFVGKQTVVETHAHPMAAQLNNAIVDSYICICSAGHAPHVYELTAAS